MNHAASQCSENKLIQIFLLRISCLLSCALQSGNRSFSLIENREKRRERQTDRPTDRLPPDLDSSSWTVHIWCPAVLPSLRLSQLPASCRMTVWLRAERNPDTEVKCSFWDHWATWRKQADRLQTTLTSPESAKPSTFCRHCSFRACCRKTSLPFLDCEQFQIPGLCWLLFRPTPRTLARLALSRLRLSVHLAWKKNFQSERC